MARGHLAFRRSGTGTAVETAFAESPLRFLTPRNHGTAAWAYTSTLGGGLVDGDRLELELSVGPGARAFVSSQGPTRVFRSARAASTTVARVEEGGALMLFPDPTACFGGARYAQRTEVSLAPGSSLALWEVLSAGRERWGSPGARARSGSFPTSTRAGSSIRRTVRSRSGWDASAPSARCSSSVRCSPASRAVREQVDAGPAGGGPLVESASPLRDGALVVRAAAPSVQQLVQRLRHHLAALPSLLGDDPWRLDASVAA